MRVRVFVDFFLDGIDAVAAVVVVELKCFGGVSVLLLYRSIEIIYMCVLARVRICVCVCVNMSLKKFELG